MCLSILVFFIDKTFKYMLLIRKFLSYVLTKLVKTPKHYMSLPINKQV